MPAPQADVLRQKVFVDTRHIKWTEKGQVRTAAACHDANLPVEAAERALALNLAVESDSERAKTLRGTKGFLVPAPETCASVDAGAQPASVSPSLTIFEPMPGLGPARNGKITVAPAVPSGASQ
jgi:hypothetical protein